MTEDFIHFIRFLDMQRYNETTEVSQSNFSDNIFQIHDQKMKHWTPFCLNSYRKDSFPTAELVVRL